MGQEQEAEVRRRAFKGYTVDAALMKLADAKAIFLHCLPAHRGEEVTTDVMEGRQSRVCDEAENWLHVQQALLAVLMGLRYGRRDVQAHAYPSDPRATGSDAYVF